MTAHATFFSANNALHFAWYDTQEVSAGTNMDHDAKKPRQRFVIKPFKGKALGIRDLACISSNDSLHFAWHIERIPKGDPDVLLWVCAGSLYDLGAKRDWYRSQLPPGANPDNLLFITSNNGAHFAWFKKGTELWVGKGPSENLGKQGTRRCALPAEVKIEFILFMATNDKRHYAFLKNGSFLVGNSDKLEHAGSGAMYDLEEVAEGYKGRE